MPRRSPILLSRPQSAQEPRYRFWGNVRPPEHRDPIRAQISSSENGEVATMRIYSPIDSWGGMWGVSATEFADALDQLSDAVNEIRLHLNSPGGEVYEGIAILNQLRQHPATVTAITDGIAASAASVLACGADELVMGENSQLMIHDAWGICIGPAVDMHSTGDLLDKISANIAGVYQSKGGEDVAHWRALMLAETWFDAQEAVDAGLADRVDGAETDDEGEGAQNAFDLSRFKHGGRAQAPPPPLPPAARPAATGPSAMQQRLHALNERRANLPV